jgi:hypothetical protein
VRIIEAEIPGGYLAETEAAVNAGEMFREQHFLTVDNRYKDDSFAEFQSGFNGISYPALGIALADDEAVDDRFDGMFFILVELNLVSQFENSSVDTHPSISGLAQILKYGIVLPFSVGDYRRYYHDTTAGFDVLNRIHYLLYGLAGYFPAALRAMRVAGAGEQEPQVIVRLGDGSHGGTGVFRGAFLVD